MKGWKRRRMARWKFLANLLSLTAVSLMTPRQEACIFNTVLEREVEEIVEILLSFLAFRLFIGAFHSCSRL
jgi:hypothetical protein